MKLFLSNLSAEERKGRRLWQNNLHNTPLRSGPYPLYRRQFGWVKVYLDQKTHQACYVPRGDLNIDADIYRMEYHADGTVKKRHEIPDQSTKIKARFCQEIFNTSTNKFEVASEEVSTMLTVQEAKQMLRSETVNWKKYDRALEKERQRQKQLDASNILASIQGPRKRRKPNEFKLLGPFVEGPNDKGLQEKAHAAEAPVAKAQVVKAQVAEAQVAKAQQEENGPGPKAVKGLQEKAQVAGAQVAEAQVAEAQVAEAQVVKAQQEGENGPGPKVVSRAKRRLPFTDNKKPKVPRLRFVTKLDKVKEAHGKSSKDVQKIVWAQGKLEDKDAWFKTLSKKPEKIASIIFDVLPKKDVVAIALQLVTNCAQDALEEALGRYRLPALQKLNENMDTKCKELIDLTSQMQKVQAQSTAPTPAVVNLAEPAQDVAGPDQVGGSDEGNASADVAGPDKVNTTGGPNVVNLAEDHAPMNTPAFVKREYWITSAKSASGYKGVIKCKRRNGWRAKVEGSTIGRFSTKAEACEAYYTYCKRYGLL